MNQGPKVNRLIAVKMSRDAIPPNGGFAAGIAFLSDPARVKEAAKSATEWVTQAIRLVREAALPNPWAQADDEAIAGELLRRIDERNLTHTVSNRTITP